MVNGTLLNFGNMIQRCLNGHFWSVAKVTLRFGCAKQLKNLERYLIGIHGRYRIQMNYNFLFHTFSLSENNCCCCLKLHVGHFLQGKRRTTPLQINFKHPSQNMCLKILIQKLLTVRNVSPGVSWDILLKLCQKGVSRSEGPFTFSVANLLQSWYTREYLLIDHLLSSLAATYALWLVMRAKLRPHCGALAHMPT